jgi:hypothetical protein
MRMALLKRNAMAAPFEQAYQEHYALRDEAAKYTSEEAPQGVREGGQVMAVHYREEEAIYIKASHDRVTVIFSTVFREETDRVFGKVFIQEFVDARRRAIQNAPQVLFRNDPPLELQGVPGVATSGTGEIGYVTFGKEGNIKPRAGAPIFLLKCFLIFGLTLWDPVLFPRHLTPQRMEDCISHIQTFRDYFHYHIKASKAYLHSRMRKRTADFLQGTFAQFSQSLCPLFPGPFYRRRKAKKKPRSVLIMSHLSSRTNYSPTQSSAGNRREGEEDGEREDFQGAGELRHAKSRFHGWRRHVFLGGGSLKGRRG